MLNKYPVESFTYGMECEWGDILRSLPIPSHLGTWDYSETDIVNLRDPYKNICSDPLGISPPVGGEINTRPTRTIDNQIDIYKSLIDYFTSAGSPPTVCCTSHTHIHVHVPGLKNDIDSLKRLMTYIKRNQHVAIDRAYKFREISDMKKVENSLMYMKFDGGRATPDYICNNIVNLATDFEHFIKLHAAGKDGVSMGRPFRYAINTYSMKHIETIEFRLFRSTLDLEELNSCFSFCRNFLNNALNDGPDLFDWIDDMPYKFPEMRWNTEEMIGWSKTKHPKERGRKNRLFQEVK